MRSAVCGVASSDGGGVRQGRAAGARRSAADRSPPGASPHRPAARPTSPPPAPLRPRLRSSGPACRASRPSPGGRPERRDDQHASARRSRSRRSRTGGAPAARGLGTGFIVSTRTASSSRTTTSSTARERSEVKLSDDEPELPAQGRRDGPADRHRRRAHRGEGPPAACRWGTRTRSRWATGWWPSATPSACRTP